MSIGVAIIGGGIFAREQHLPAVEACQHLTLKAVYSRSLKSAQSLATDATKVDLYSDESETDKSYDALLKRQDIQAVIIALPIANQPQYIKAALSAGKHVLSEKPIAGTISEAVDLIKWYKSEILPQSKSATWSVAENFRFLASFARGAEIGSQLGRVLNFSLKMQTYIGGGKYFETAWRKEPTHQGGFVLDGGVHFVAGLRQLLTPDTETNVNDTIQWVSAFTRQNQKHLPPIDTVDSCVRTKSGATGTISISFGTTIKGDEYSAAYERGSIHLSPSSGRASEVAAGKPAGRGKMIVTTKRNSEGNDERTSEDVADEGSGVEPEVRAWAESLVAGKPDPRQTPEQALADLEIIEAILTSGDQNGQLQQLQYQIPSPLSSSITKKAQASA